MRSIQHGQKPDTGPEALEGFCSNPSNRLYFLAAFPGQQSLSTGHRCHLMANSYSMRVPGFAAHLVKVER